MWIARDADNSLWLFEEKPCKSDYVWISSLGVGVQFRINEKLFPTVKWADEEPRELVLKPIMKNKI